MIKRLALFLLLITLFVSCKDDNEKRLIAQEKERQKKEVIFNKINNSWRFRTIELQPKAQALIGDWSEWRLFFTELNQKPTSSIGAFQNKSKDLSKKAEELVETIPAALFIPEFKSRFLVLSTQFRSLELYLTLDDIPDEKVIYFINEINKQLASIELQLEELVRRSEVPIEQGEADLLRMLDTSRAVKNVPKNIEIIE
ncbi:hypothetical protein [Flavobacterium sp. UBA6135]|uniref:hypothetical protein n=1 Tax=Flavobacterium sp. UBA6135 TaxID=1946553 RepID=UPI0025C073FA|nr:hypothetical protein [Flavobacterium sp. UBA6135]